MDTQRLALNAATNYLRMVVLIGTTVALTPRIIEHLGPGGFGLWAIVNAAVGLATLLDLGFGNAVLKAAAESTSDARIAQRNRLFSTLLATTLGISVVGAIVALACASRFPVWLGVPADHAREATTVFLILSARQLLVVLPLALYRGLLYGEGRLVEINAIQVVTTLCQAAATWVALGAGHGLVTMALLTLAGGLAEHVAYAWLAPRRVPSLTVSPRLAEVAALREAGSFCSASFLIGISGLVLLKTDPLLAKLFLPLSAVALYAVALKIAENMLLLVKQLANALTPVIARLNSEGTPEALRQVLLSSTKFLLVPGMLGLVGTIVHGRTALALWIGPSFVDAWPVLVVLMVAMTITISELPAGNLLVLGGRHAVGARAAVASTVINIVASLVLVRWLGLIGVAGGTVVAGVIVDLGLVVGSALRWQRIPVGEFVRHVWVPVIVAGMAQWIAVRALATVAGEPTTVATLLMSAATGAAAFLATFALVGLTHAERARVITDLVRPMTARLARLAGLDLRTQAEGAR